MKIYPSIHRIKSMSGQRVDTDLNIPIAYIDTDTATYSISKNISGNYNKDSRKEILPGQEFDTIKIKAFNHFGEYVDITPHLKRKGGKYVYTPESISFTPQTFLYKATVKKNMQYSIGNSYNIRAVCVDDPDSLDLSQRLAPLLINPSDREKLPVNISINENSQNISSLTTGSMVDTDFVFIESPDGVHYDDTEKPTKIDIDELLNNHTNIWMSLEYSTTFETYDYGVEKSYNMKSPIVINNASVKCKKVFDQSRIVEKPGIAYHYLFDTATYSPVIVEERLGKGFVVYSTDEVLKNPSKYASMIYEVMIYCYLNSYASTTPVKEWISDAVPDYHIVNNKLSKKHNFTSSLNLYNYFKLKDAEMSLYNVQIFDDPNAKRYYENTTTNTKGIETVTTYSSNNISFSGYTGGHLIFNKSQAATVYSLKDPEKPYGWTSIYNGSEIIYVESIYYLIEESLEDKVFIEERGDNLSIKISPFKNSLKNINIQNVTNITIPLFKSSDGEFVKVRSSNYFIYMNNGKIDFCDEYEWNNTQDLMFTVLIDQDVNKTTIFDMRQLGGGLPEDEADNYNLLDIGHINGRPYRKTGTIVITLPTKYKQLENEIQKAVNKYISAEEFPIIIFEDKEE